MFDIDTFVDGLEDGNFLEDFPLELPLKYLTPEEMADDGLTDDE